MPVKSKIADLKIIEAVLFIVVNKSTQLQAFQFIQGYNYRPQFRNFTEFCQINYLFNANHNRKGFALQQSGANEPGPNSSTY